MCNLPNIQCGPRPELPVVIFRHDAGNHATRTLHLRMEHDSDVKTDLVTIGNIDYIRVSAGWFTLKEKHVTQLLEAVTKATKADVAVCTYWTKLSIFWNLVKTWKLQYFFKIALQIMGVGDR